MLLPDTNQRPLSFVLAKWISVTAVAATPLTFVVAAIMQSVDALHFAIATVIAVPFFAVCGYYMCLFVYSGFESRQTKEPMDIASSNWPLPLRLLNQIYRQNQRAQAVFASIFIQIFVVAWSGFQLLFVIAEIVLGLSGQLRG